MKYPSFSGAIRSKYRNSRCRSIKLSIIATTPFHHIKTNVFEGYLEGSIIHATLSIDLIISFFIRIRILDIACMVQITFLGNSFNIVDKMIEIYIKKCCGLIYFGFLQFETGFLRNF